MTKKLVDWSKDPVLLGHDMDVLNLTFFRVTDRQPEPDDLAQYLVLANPRSNALYFPCLDIS